MHLETRPDVIIPLLPQVVEIANAEKEALGFLAESAYREAAARKRLYLMVDQGTSGTVVAGFILFGGVYPNARIQQVGVRPELRRARVGSRLVASLVSELEKQHYLTVTAKIASDLPAALRFYRRSGFEQVSTKKGGSARNRKIHVHVRNLDTPSLFTTTRLDPAPSINIRSKVNPPLYAFDLNVLFDLVRSRPRHELAAGLFAAALDHRVRLVVSSEFLKELQRTSKGVAEDPILRMAARLPQLPTVASDLLEKTAKQIHEVVFDQPQRRGAGSIQARSDCRHLAHAAIARASAFITSDEAILDAQPQLLRRFGIDVASIDELLEVIPTDLVPDGSDRARVGEYEVVPLDQAALRDQLVRENASVAMLERYGAGDDRTTGRLVLEGGVVAAFGCLCAAPREDHFRLLVYVRPDVLEPEALADYLISALVRSASRNAPAVLLLDLLPGQSAARKVAKSRGFRQIPGTRDLGKMALGRPLTPLRWRKLSDVMRRRAGLDLSLDAASGVLRLTDQSKVSIDTSWAQLEEILAPTLLLEPNRGGVIVPIARHYADDLLGTALQQQLGFIERRRATLLARRAYVNSPRTSKVMEPGAPIFFYESVRSGGRGAIVAVARIADSMVIEKALVGNDKRGMLVVDDLDSFSATERVLLTSFDNLLPFPHPVTLKTLKHLGAAGTSNLISATKVTEAAATAILDAGWPDE